MKYLLFIGFILALYSCANKTTQTEDKTDTTSTGKIPDLVPYCDTIKLKIKYLEGINEVIDTASLGIRCGFVSSAKPNEFAKVSGVIVKTSTGKEIDPNNITWSAQRK